jgi:polar amino acid transport system substrate-binding protein
MFSTRLFKGVVASAVLTLTFNTYAQSVPTLKEGALSVGTDLSWAPFGYYDKGAPAGFDAELMSKISKGLGLTLKINDIRFANLITGLAGHKFDVIASALYITPARAKLIDYIPYIKTAGSLMTLQGSAFQPLTQNELCGKRVASLKGAAWVPTLITLSAEHCVKAGQGPISVQEYDSSPLAAQALLAGAADVQFENTAVCQMLVKQTQGRLQITSKTLLDPVVLGLAVAKGNTELVKALTEQLDRLKQNGEFQALLASYNVQEPTAEDIAAAFAEQ